MQYRRLKDFPELKGFMDEILEVCKKHNVSISHEDGHGGFLIETPYDEFNSDWFKDAFITDKDGHIIDHFCKELDYCICGQTAIEPNEDCPVHGAGTYPKRCTICGRFLKNENSEEPTQS